MCRSIPFLAILVLALVSCGDGSPPTADIPQCGDDEELQGKLDAARQELERVMRAGDYDYRSDPGTAHALYEEALDFCGNSIEALFGSAVTAVLVLNQDDVFQAVADSIDSWTSDGGNETEPDPGSPAEGEADALTTLAVSAAFEPHRLLHSMAQSAIFDPLAMADIQVMLVDRAIPTLDLAEERIEGLLELPGDPMFLLTPGMTGEDGIEVDEGDYYILLALVRAARAGALLLSSYHLDFQGSGQDYGFLADRNDSLLGVRLLELEADPLFLTLLDEGPSRLARVRTDLIATTTAIGNAYDAIRAETDEQDDDLVGPRDLDDLDEEIAEMREDVNAAQEWDDVTDIMREIRTILDGPVVYRENWDDDESTPDADLMINLRVLFDDPVRDLRSLLPHHKYHPRQVWNRGNLVYFTRTRATEDVEEVELPYFPDPTFNGVLPEILTSEELHTLLGLGITRSGVLTVFQFGPLAPGRTR